MAMWEIYTSMSTNQIKQNHHSVICIFLFPEHGSLLITVEFPMPASYIFFYSVWVKVHVIESMADDTDPNGLLGNLIFS